MSNSSSEIPWFAEAWLEQRRRGAVRAQEVRDQELREMDRDAALANLSILGDRDSADRNDPYDCGLVKQQRWFIRAKLLELLSSQKES